MTKILGVDCSTNSLAFAVFEDDTLKKWGEVGFGKGDIHHRAGNANRVANALAADPIFSDLDAVAYEAAVYINNRQTVIDLSMLLGAAVAPFVKTGISCGRVPPVTWQSFIGNKVFSKAEKADLKAQHPTRSATWLSGEMRSIRKRRTIDWVKKEYGVTIDSDNISDAIGVGYWRLHNGS